jgi:MFS family permease
MGRTDMHCHSPGSRAQPVSESPSEQARPTKVTPRSSRTGVLRTVTALRFRNYRLYWCGQIISLMGTSMQTIGQSWLVLELTHSALQLGLVGALQFLPVLLFSAFGGVFADRWPKRRILLVTESVAMFQAVLLWALTASGTIHLWHIYVLALLLGLTSSLDQPTRSAFIVELVGRRDLPNAVALNSALVNLARIIGPGFGGVLVAASGVTTLFLLNALSFLAVLVALALMNSRELHATAHPHTGAGKQQTTWQSLREGMGYVWSTPAVTLLILVVGLVLLFGANFTVVLPLFATTVLHIGAAGFGFLSAALSVGALLSALWLAWSHQQPTIRRVLIGLLVFTGLEAAFAVSRSYPLSLVLLAGVGGAETIFGALAITTLQTIAPDHLRGRVVGVYVLFFTGSIPLGYLLAGWLSSRYGASTGLLICALLSLLVVGAGWMWRSPQNRIWPWRHTSSHPCAALRRQRPTGLHHALVILKQPPTAEQPGEPCRGAPSVAFHPPAKHTSWTAAMRTRQRQSGRKPPRARAGPRAARASPPGLPPAARLPPASPQAVSA